MSETARQRLATPFTDVRLVAHYFREDPALAWVAFVKGPALHALVCSWRGHVCEDSLHRSLGACERCGVWGLVAEVAEIG